MLTTPQSKSSKRVWTRLGRGLVGLILGLGLIAGGVLALSPTLAQQVEDKVVDLLQIRGRWLGFIPIYFEPMPPTTPLTTPLPQTGAAKGPLRPHPTNPRYFTDGSGQAILLTGAHTWTNLQDVGDNNPPPVFDYTGFLDFLTAKHYNFFRLWRWEQARWGSWNGIDGLRYAPHPYLRPGPGSALDGLPKFDLSQFDQTYFDRMRQRIEQAGERGFYVSVMLFDGWSMEDKGGWGYNPWRGHPFHAENNINGVNGDPNNDGQGLETHSLTHPAVLAMQEAYVRKVIDTVNDLDNVLYEISNESGPQSIEWQYHLIRFIKSYEATLPKQHPVGMTGLWPWPNNNREEANAALYASPADWISPAGDLYYRPLATGDKVIIADTDHLCGICGDRVWAWTSFLSGENPLFMDVWSCAPWWYPNDCNRPVWPSLRDNLGYIRDYALRLNLAAMTPQPGLASTNLVLANAAAQNAEYLVYLPKGGNVQVDLSATPGELFVEWFNPESGKITTGEKVNGGEQRSFTAPFSGDAVLYLYQTPTAVQYQLHTTVVGQGSVRVEPPGPYPQNQAVTLTARPAIDWQFQGWSGDLSDRANPTTVVMSQDLTVTATFTPVTPAQYTITLQITGSGSIALFPVGPFTTGQVVTLTAQPDPGWQFSHWTGAGAGATNPITLTVTGNEVVAATFLSESVQAPYTLTLNIVGAGVVQLVPDQLTYAPGQPITLTAVPAANWQFDHWSGTLSGQRNPQLLAISEGQVITATFMPVSASAGLSLTVVTVGQGAVAVHPTGPYQTAQQVQLTALPTAGWSFAGWSGLLTSTQNPLTTFISQTQTITAHFQTNRAYISVVIKAKP